ncbi:M48 family metalloprotease [Erythrobacter sp. LQ02-29]|uniref:M48 family metalloprotease n=1 Tax=Erythrobacter sp. LQ02-29 TaxID=2920384 RepID=UPI001F4E48A6|nr:M48 family metalloprotease [Erythrobacter sp. LQ02-29]MCP9221907.1 M48 family metalloprotease [Erythrobacter sp. LQ02-29]
MRFLRNALLALAVCAFAARPTMAQEILRDTESEALLQDMAAPIVKAAGFQPGAIDIVLLNDPSINAFVAGGQAIYIHSGLIETADNANEVQGVIAHEMGHITGGHVIRSSEGMADASRISILSLLLGAVAVAAGSAEAGMGAIMAGQRAALGKFLAFTRVQESSADAAGAKFLSDAGISGRGSLAFFDKLMGEEIRHGISQDDDEQFVRTHPMTGDRMSRLRDVYSKDPAWNTPVDPQLQSRFVLMKAKLEGYLATPEATLRDYPLSRDDEAALYARAYAYHKDARMDQAIAETDALLSREPDNPYFLELKGQVLLESGRPDEALESLRRANELTRNSPLIAAIFGHALIATEDPAHYDEARQVLRAAVARDRDNPFAWYQLGVVYAAQGDEPRARLASAEQQILSREYARALMSARAAESALPKDTPDWLRAQDIRMQAEAELERSRDRR